MTNTLEEAELIVETMPIELVRPAPDNPRDTLGELGELTDSIESNGILQPLIVKGTGELGDDDREVVLVIAGHRRLAAARLAELSHVPVIVRNDIDEANRQSAMFVENFHRLDLGPIEKARALKQLADAGVMQKDIAAQVGATQPTVSKLLALLKLPEKAQKWVATGKMTQEDAVALAALPASKVKQLSEDGPPPDWRIRNAKNDIEREKRHAAAVKEVATKGWKLLEQDPELFQQLELEGNHEPVALDDDRHAPRGTLAHIDPDAHVSEPCHAVYVDGMGQINPACTDPARHPRPQGWKSPYETEIEEMRKARGGPIPSTVSPAQQQVHEHRARIVAAVGPIKEQCTELLSTNVAAESIVDFGVLAMLVDDDWHGGAVADLLGLPSGGYSVDPLITAMTETDGSADGLKVLHAWGLAYGLRALEELAGSVLAGDEREDEEWFVVGSRRMLVHLGGLFEFANVPSLDEFVASMTPDSDLDDDAGAPTVEVYKQRGKYKRRCSECGDLDGQNTEEDLANERAAQHLLEKHGIEVAA